MDGLAHRRAMIHAAFAPADRIAAEQASRFGVLSFSRPRRQARNPDTATMVDDIDRALERLSPVADDPAGAGPMKHASVTSQAILDYLRIVHGIDIAEIRQEIIAVVQPYVAQGATCVTLGGTTYSLNEIGRVVAVSNAKSPAAHARRVGAVTTGRQVKARRSRVAEEEADEWVDDL